MINVLIVVILNIKQMYNNIIKYLNIIKEMNIYNGKDMEYVFSKIIEYSKINNKYYFYSKDYELLDFSLEFCGKENKIKNIFRLSYFGTNIYFIKEIFIYFGYKKSFTMFLKKYKNYLTFLKDNFLTCGFKFKKGKIIELKIYFDLNKSEKLLNLESIDIDLKKIKSSVLLKSFTYDFNGLIEEKLYIPPDIISLKYSEEKLKNNKKYNYFKKSDYYDILYRYKSGKLNSIKFYYNIGEDIFLNNIIKEKFNNIIKKEYFIGLNIKEELGVDFSLKTGINKYNYYIGLYK